VYEKDLPPPISAKGLSFRSAAFSLEESAVCGRQFSPINLASSLGLRAKGKQLFHSR
jgi:hypothetical protein